MQAEQEKHLSVTAELFTIPQVAAYLGVGRSQVYKLIAQGLPIIRLGRLVRIHRVSLQQWLLDQEQKAPIL